MNVTGKVYVRYLKPIMPDEAATRDEMLVLVCTYCDYYVFILLYTVV